jgi:hypothetical protein
VRPIPAPDPISSIAISYNPGAWRVVFTLASGATINRADQYAIGDTSDNTLSQWPKCIVRPSAELEIDSTRRELPSWFTDFRASLPT